MTLRGTLRGAAALALIVSVGAGQSATATSGDSLTDRAAAIVSTVVSGQPLKVVVTSTGANGSPQFTTTVASTISQARTLVRSALSAGQSVSMAQPVSMAASNDTYRSKQWALNTLNADNAWRYTKGGTVKKTKKKVQRTRVKVAVIDTGVATDHPDLKANLLGGYNAITPGSSWYDDNGHGTHVAGIIAALENNKRGIAGLAPGAAILPVKVLDRDGNGSTDDVARGVTWAADNGAKVINLSLSGSTPDAALETAVAYAQRKGALVVAAAGNAGSARSCGLLILMCGPNVQYPAAYSGVIGVASIDSNRSLSSYSSTGDWIDVAAPGGSILSTVPATNRLGCGTSTYCTISGTSMAAPYVSAAAALARTNSTWTATKTATFLQSTATDLGAKGRDTSFGAGLINPFALVKKAITR